jgi:hypothetical protein
MIIEENNNQQKPLDQYPDKIKISKLPFMLQGWNTTFYKTKKISEGFPIYHLKPYKLYYVIPIIGATIKVKNGQWCFYRDCDWDFMFSNDTLFGHWNISDTYELHGAHDMNVQAIY